MEIKEKIKKYAKLRGYKNPGINFETLSKAYDNAGKAQRIEFEREMDNYFQAIKDGKIKKGQSILHTVYYEGDTDTPDKGD